MSTKVIPGERVEYRVDAPVDFGIDATVVGFVEGWIELELLEAETKSTDWEWLLHCNHRDDSKLRSNLLEAALKPYKLFFSGFYADREQRAVRFSLRRNDAKSEAKVIAGLTMLLPYLKGEPKLISVLEGTLSEFGIYHVECQDALKATLIRTSYGAPSNVFSGTLAEVVHYVRLNHPIDRGE